MYFYATAADIVMTNERFQYPCSLEYISIKKDGVSDHIEKKRFRFRF